MFPGTGAPDAVISTPALNEEPPSSAGERVPLLRIATGRSGDKGNFANIGLIARTPELAAVLREQVTAERRVLRVGVGRPAPAVGVAGNGRDQRRAHHAHTAQARDPVGRGLPRRGRPVPPRPGRRRGRRADGADACGVLRI
jgi:hypothetical protein